MCRQNPEMNVTRSIFNFSDPELDETVGPGGTREDGQIADESDEHVAPSRPRLVAGQDSHDKDSHEDDKDTTDSDCAEDTGVPATGAPVTPKTGVAAAEPPAAKSSSKGRHFGGRYFDPLDISLKCNNCPAWVISPAIVPRPK